MSPIIIGVIALAVLILIPMTVKIVTEYERGVIFRLGRVIDTKGPGLIYVVPVIDKMQKISLRLEVIDVPPQDVITKDNVSVKVNAVVYFRVMDPRKSVIDVANFYLATHQLSQTTLRSVCGQAMLDEILAERDKINTQLQEIIDRHSDPWGIKVSSVEVKHIDLPPDMQRAMAKQAEAERERRAKIIHAEGEFQAAQKLFEASEIIAKEPVAIQLRFLQTLAEVATENNSTIIFPIPIDVLTPFIGKQEKKE